MPTATFLLPVVKFGHSFTPQLGHINVALNSPDDPTAVRIPSAKASGNGAWFAVKCIGTGGVTLLVAQGDTLDGGEGEAHDIASDRDCQFYVSDGVSTWYLVANVKHTFEQGLT